MTDHAAMKARAERAFTHYVAPLQTLPGLYEPVHLARKLAVDVLELLAALDAERDEAHMYIAELERELSILRHDFDCVVAALHREIRNNRQTTDPHDEETT